MGFPSTMIRRWGCHWEPYAAVCNGIPLLSASAVARACVAARHGLALLALENGKEDNQMAWTTPTLVEICIGLEINGYLPAEF